MSVLLFFLCVLNVCVCVCVCVAFIYLFPISSIYKRIQQCFLVVSPSLSLVVVLAEYIYLTPLSLFSSNNPPNNIQQKKLGKPRFTPPQLTPQILPEKTQMLRKATALIGVSAIGGYCADMTINDDWDSWSDMFRTKISAEERLKHPRKKLVILGTDGTTYLSSFYRH